MADVLQESAESKKPRGHLDPQGFADHIAFHTYLPPERLRPFLEHFWTLAWHDLPEPYHSEQVMHTPCVDLFVSAEEAGIQGTFRALRTYTAVGNGRIIGARFLPGAFHLLWSGSMLELQDTNLPLARAFPELDVQRLLALSDADAIAEMATLLEARLPAQDDNVTIINQIITIVKKDDAPQTVAEVARLIGRSERWIQQLFQDYVGVGLKWIMLRHKFLAAASAVRDADEPDWSGVAYELGYSSQQHFITDFKRIVGKTPLQYKKDLG